MFIYHGDEIEQIWDVLEKFDAMPEIDDKTKRKISERFDGILSTFSDEHWQAGFDTGEDLH
jgi:hypothetical protein